MVNIIFFPKYPLCHCEHARTLSETEAVYFKAPLPHRDAGMKAWCEGCAIPRTKGKSFVFFSAKLTQQNLLLARPHSDFMGKKKKWKKKTHRHKSRRCVGGKWAKWERRKERVKQVDVWVSAVLCLALIGELGKEWCSSVHPSTGCASPPDLTKP